MTPWKEPTEARGRHAEAGHLIGTGRSVGRRSSGDPPAAKVDASLGYQTTDCCCLHRKRSRCHVSVTMEFSVAIIFFCALAFTETSRTAHARTKAVNVDATSISSNATLGISPRRALQEVQSAPISMNTKRSGRSSKRILYIITSLAQYNTGTRSTTKGSDRLQETLIPVMRESVLSMIGSGHTVDGKFFDAEPSRLRHPQHILDT
jgi:hypothetical protein